MSTLSCLLVVVVKYNAAATAASKSAVRREWDIAAAKLKVSPMAEAVAWLDEILPYYGKGKGKKAKGKAKPKKGQSSHE